MLKTTLALITFSLLISIAIIACGKRVPPQPPLRPLISPIYGFQRGESIILTWQSPSKAVKANIYRLIEPISAPAQISEEEFSNRSTLIASVPADSKLYQDKLQFADQPVRIYYAVKFVNPSGQQTSPSALFSIAPSPKIPLPPVLTSTETSQERIRIRWTAPDKNIDGSSPANVLGYNIYRIENNLVKLLNRFPIQQESFDDKFFEFEKTYKYLVRSVGINQTGESTESDDSNIIEITPKDTFAPAPPEGVTIAASPNEISIFFAANRENDIAGYLIFRSENQALPLDKWKKITPEPLTTTTFQDKQVDSGKTYFYFVQAVDRFGNVSPPSEIVSETVP